MSSLSSVDSVPHSNGNGNGNGSGKVNGLVVARAPLGTYMPAGGCGCACGVSSAKWVCILWWWVGACAFCGGGWVRVRSVVVGSMMCVHRACVCVWWCACGGVYGAGGYVGPAV